VSAPGSAASDGLSFLSVAVLSERYRRGELSPVEVVRASLERIEQLDGRLNAWITVAADEALAAAGEAERSLRAGEDRGPLHGIPVALKDNVDTAGMPTTCASRILRSNVPASDAAVAERLRDAGAIVVGKTNLLEFAYGIVHPDFGQCNNPWNTDRTSGGSSSGSAAAVAAGMVPLAVGTDTGGSIRIPAAYCGIVGLKPTYGLVSHRGVFPLSWSLDHVGPLARSAEDALLLLRAMAGPGTGGGGGSHAAEDGLAGVRVGIVREHLGADLRPGVRAAFDAAVGAMSEAGARVDEIGIPTLAHADDAEMAIIAPEATAVHEGWLRSRPQDYAPMTRVQLEMGLTIPATEYVRAQRFRSVLSSRFAEAFERVDLVVSPTVAWVAPAEDPAIAGDEGATEGRRTGPYNLTGMPAVTVPCGLGEDGLPAALQLAGPWWSDELVLRAAAAFEVRSGWGTPVPPAVSGEEAS
jgi:aspartyl-tRNA(Asn)/glutamyl-tRNA(Gln) amidotransferase subunit A